MIDFLDEQNNYKNLLKSMTFPCTVNEIWLSKINPKKYTWNRFERSYISSKNMAFPSSFKVCLVFNLVNIKRKNVPCCGHQSSTNLLSAIYFEAIILKQKKNLVKYFLTLKFFKSQQFKINFDAKKTYLWITSRFIT